MKLSTHPESTVARKIYKFLPCCNEILQAVPAKYKKQVSNLWRGKMPLFTVLSFLTQIGGKLENNLNKLLKKRTVHVLRQTTVPMSHH